MRTVSKHLAAIMFTDIVGYTKMMSQDEAKTLELVKQNRELQMSIVAKHNGKWIKEMGDGTMAQFNTALDAVNCAVEIQRNAKNDFEAPIRIGLHLGDLIFERGDVYGDGVNIASRLESQADPGGIYISDTIYKTVKGKGEFYFKEVGNLKLKNVEEPIKTYAVIEKEEAETLIKQSKSSARNRSIVYTVLILLLISAFFWGKEKGIFEKGSERPTITVLPFTQLEGHESDEYLKDGLSEELIRSLGKIKSLLVTNAVSTKQYLSATLPVFNEDEKDGSSIYLVKGQFRKNDPRIAIDIQVLDENENMLYENSYSEDMAKLPLLLGSIAMDISDAINIRINKETEKSLIDVASVNPRVYELILKGNTQIGLYRFNDMNQSQVYFAQAVDEFPADPRAWAGLAEGLVDLGHSPAAPADAWVRAKAAAIRAIQLDSTLAEAWAALAHTKTYFEWDYEGAEFCYQKANDLNPNLAMNHYHYAWHSYLFDRIELAIEEHKIAQKLDPFFPLHTNWLIFLLVENGQFEEARKEIKRSFRVRKENPMAHFQFGRLLMAEGKPDSALVEFKIASKAHPVFKWMGECPCYMETGNIEAGMQCIEEINSIPLNGFSALQIARLYAQIDSVDQYFKYVNFEPAHAWAPWQRKMIYNEKIMNDPRFNELMKKMNLPMPTIKLPPLSARK